MAANTERTAAERRIADLEGQVAELAARIEEVAREACMLRAIEEVFADTAPAYGAAVPRRRPRHLSVVGGGGS